MENANNELLTAEQFAEARPDLPEGGRWVDFVAGRVVHLDPPDPLHGNVVLNLSKTLARYLEEHAAEEIGYLCFELGLLVKRSPDTIHFPAVSFFSGGRPFDESDKTYTDVVPRLVVEIASTNSRRRGLADRVAAFQRRSVEFVWIADTVERRVHVVQSGMGTTSYGPGESLSGDPVFAGLCMNVDDLFASPSWWK